MKLRNSPERASRNENGNGSGNDNGAEKHVAFVDEEKPRKMLAEYRATLQGKLELTLRKEMLSSSSLVSPVQIRQFQRKPERTRENICCIIRSWRRAGDAVDIRSFRYSTAQDTHYCLYFAKSLL
jgi:hypothetical protein